MKKEKEMLKKEKARHAMLQKRYRELVKSREWCVCWRNCECGGEGILGNGLVEYELMQIWY